MSASGAGRSIGLIGGIGPAATIVYYRALVAAHAKADRKLALTIVNADAAEMTGNMAAGRPDLQAAIFARHIDALMAGGCEMAAITSMGGHFCIDLLRPMASLPLIEAKPALESWFAASPHVRVGVLGTRTVMQTGLYGLSAVEVVAPQGPDLEAVHDAYVALAVAGHATEAQRAFFLEAGARLVREQGAEIVVLGGTDLSVAFDGADLPYPIVDSALIHADAIARLALAEGAAA